jgi:hypothetical protein
MLGNEPDLLRDGRGRAGGSALVSATNGKTTTTWLLAEALRARRIAVGDQPHRREHAGGDRGGARHREPQQRRGGSEVDERWASEGGRSPWY